MERAKNRIRIGFGLGALLIQASSHAGMSFSVTFDDPGSEWVSYYTAISNQVIASGNEWMNYLGQPSFESQLAVQISFAEIPTANGRSAAMAYVGTDQGSTVWETGSAAKLRDGTDVNGIAPDVEFTIGIDGFLQHELWFDPTPQDLTDDVVPLTQIDARSVFLHEFGHALGFIGWRDWTTAELPGNYLSTFDQFVVGGNGSPVYFAGPNAVAEYGGLVPLTYGNLFHLGNDLASGLPGSDLVPDLMNGVVFYRGSRYEVSQLDLAILRDVGVPFATQVPEPASWAMLLVGAAGVGAAVRRRSMLRS